MPSRKLNKIINQNAKQVDALTKTNLKKQYSIIKKEIKRRQKGFQKFGDDVPRAFRDLSPINKAGKEYMQDIVKHASAWMRGRGSTITGRRKQVKGMLRQLRDRGIDVNSVSEMNDYWNFLNDMDVRYSNIKGYDSEQSVILWNEAKRLGLNVNQFKRNMDFWLEHADDLMNAKPLERKNVKPSDYAKQLGLGSIRSSRKRRR